MFTAKVTGLMPTGEDFKRMIPAVLRGTALGSALGILPGGGALLAAFAAYTIEKKTKLQPGRSAVRQGQHPRRGGARVGQQRRLADLLHPAADAGHSAQRRDGADGGRHDHPQHPAGPQVMTSNPQLFWGLIASMWIGNLMLIILNLPLIGMWIKLLTVPYRWLFPAIVLFCAIGVYSTNNNTFDIWMVAPSASWLHVHQNWAASLRRCCWASSSGR